MRSWTTGLIFSAALLGCESGSAVPATGVPNATPGVSLTTSKSAISTPRGWNAIVDVGLTRTGGFTAGVELSVEGLPPKVTATFTTPMIPALGIGTRLNIDVDSTALVGTYPLTIRAQGQGVTTATTVLTLVVPHPSFRLELEPTVTYANSPTAGPFAVITATVIRDNGFRGTVTLEASGIPPGITLGGVRTIRPNEHQGTVILLFGATAPPGSYPIVVRGTGTEVDPRTATINLVIPVR